MPADLERQVREQIDAVQKWGLQSGAPVWIRFFASFAPTVPRGVVMRELSGFDPLDVTEAYDRSYAPLGFRRSAEEALEVRGQTAPFPFGDEAVRSRLRQVAAIVERIGDCLELNWHLGEPSSSTERGVAPRLILITGIMAAGKSTVAQALAERLPKSVHLRGDAFRRMTVSGRVEMGSEPAAEALEQLALRYRVAAAAANEYRRAGFTVVYQDIVLGPMLRDVIALHPAPVHLVVLCPNARAVAEREAGRAKRGYGSFSVEQLDRALRDETPRLGLWLDTSDLGVDATVERILADLGAARLD